MFGDTPIPVRGAPLHPLFSRGARYGLHSIITQVARTVDDDGGVRCQVLSSTGRRSSCNP